jgi:uncharacterized protein involved in outer membrane biogenesis
MKRKTAGIAAITAVVLIAAYAAAGFLGVPRLVSSGLVDHLQQAYGRAATLGEVRFNPFTFRFEARDLAVRDDTDAPVLAFDRLLVDFELASLWHRAWTFAVIEVDRPYARVVQLEDGRLNLAVLFTAQEPAPPPQADATLPRIRIDRLAVAAGRVDFEDRMRDRPFATHFAPVTFELADFRSEGAGNAFRLDAGSEVGAQFSFAGSLALAPIASSGRISIARLPATTIDQYLGELLPVTLTAGVVDLALDYEIELPGEGLTGRIAVPEIRIRELATVAPGHEQAWLFPEIDVTDSRLDLAARTAHVSSIELRGASLPLWRDATGLQAPGLLPAESAAAPTSVPVPATTAMTTPATATAEAGTTAEPAEWRFRLDRFALTDAALPFEDRQLTPATSLTLRVPQLSVEGIKLPAANPLSVAATLESSAGGRLVARGSVAMEPLAAEIDVDLSELSILPIQPYVAAQTDLLIDAGTLSTRGRLQYREGAQPQVQWAGDVSVANLKTRDRPLREDFINWRLLELRGIEYQDAPAVLDIREVVATGAYLRLVLAADGSSNIESVLRIDPEAQPTAVAVPAPTPAPAAAPAAAPATAPALRSSIGIVRIVDGSTNFADYAVQPNFAIAIQQLGGAITGLSSNPAARARVDLEGRVDRYAPVTVAGEVNYLSAESFTDLTAKFSNIELTTFNPYSGKFAGYSIDKGKLSIEASYRIENRQLDAGHHLVLNQLELGGKVDSPDAMSLPLKLAIALLKDRNGVIDLDLPVSGSLDDPEFRVGPIIWKMVVNLLTKIVTAPFALLGSLFGGGEELALLDFAPGSAALDEAASGKLETLRKGLVERPGLNLDIPAIADPSLDRAALEEQRWTAALDAAGSEPGERWRTDRNDYLQRLVALHRERLGSKPDLPKPPKPAAGEPAVDPVEYAIESLEPLLRPTVTVEEAELEALAQARAAAVQDALLSDATVEPQRVFIVSGEPEPQPGIVRMQLTLK